MINEYDTHTARLWRVWLAHDDKVASRSLSGEDIPASGPHYCELQGASRPVRELERQSGGFV